MRSKKGIYKTVYFDRKVFTKIQDMAKKEDRSINYIINRFLAEAFKK